MLRPGRLSHQPGPLLGPLACKIHSDRSSPGEQRLRSRSHAAPGRLALDSCALRYGIRSNGQYVARLHISGAGANDWEDIAIGPGPVKGKSYIYIAAAWIIIY